MNRSRSYGLLGSFALALAACSVSTAPTGSTHDAVSGTELCVAPGTWQLTYTRQPGSSPLCPPIDREAYDEQGGIAHASRCDDGCTCTDDVAPYPSCSLSWRQVCSGDKVRQADVTLTRSSSESYAGSATLRIGDITCSYDLDYARIAP